MLHGSFEMNNGNNRAEDSWDPFKDVGEAMQSGFGLQKHHAQLNESTIVLYSIEMLL